MVGREGFEPSEACASRFTVCPRWPLEYLPMDVCGKTDWSAPETGNLPVKYKAKTGVWQ